VPAEFDYLRTGWFYQHTAIGSLRYAYPPGWLLIAIYSVLPLTGLGQEARRRTARGRELEPGLDRSPGDESRHGI
jgi:hypothetical protein